MSLSIQQINHGLQEEFIQRMLIKTVVNNLFSYPRAAETVQSSIAFLINARSCSAPHSKIEKTSLAAVAARVVAYAKELSASHKAVYLFFSASPQATKLTMDQNSPEEFTSQSVRC